MLKICSKCNGETWLHFLRLWETSCYRLADWSELGEWKQFVLPKHQHGLLPHDAKHSKTRTTWTLSHRECLKSAARNILLVGFFLPSVKFNVKAIPLQASTSPEDSRRLRLQIRWQSADESRKFVIPTHRPPLPFKKYSWYSFLLEAESTPGP